MIYITGAITAESYLKFCLEFDVAERKTKPIEVELTSEGGDPNYALAYYSKIKTSKLKVIITARGFCQSAGTLILAAGDVRMATPETIFMFHESPVKFKGTATEIKDLLQNQEEEAHWINFLHKAIGNYEQLVRMHTTTTYFKCDKAKEINLLTDIQEYTK